MDAHDADGVRAAAAELLDMRRRRRIERDLPPALRPSDLAAAYRVQDAVVTALLPDGERRIGYKVACTSEIAQQALRIDRPLFGRLLSHTTTAGVRPGGARLRATDFVHRVVEAEFGFLIGSDVPAVDGGHTHATVSEHIGAVIPAIEIVDHRFESWTVGALQVAADNAIHGWWVHGAPVESWRHLDLAAARVVVERGGEVVTTGSGSAVLGHPLTVMAWLADELPRFGLGLRAGDLVTTGVTTDVFEAEAGDDLVAEFAGIGGVSLGFT
jgi:2-keto-4-pentenoate hydratase